MKRIVTVSELSKLLHVTREYIRQLVRDKRIKPDYTAGTGLFYWNKKSVERLIRIHNRDKDLPRRYRRSWNIREGNNHE